MILSVAKEMQNEIFKVMKDYRGLAFMLERSGSKVIFDERRYSSK